jgi:hypothetical protein
LKGLPAIDQPTRAGDMTGFVGRKKRDDRRDIGRLTDAAERDAIGETLCASAIRGLVAGWHA